jgi:hypothetical protein
LAFFQLFDQLLQVMLCLFQIRDYLALHLSLTIHELLVMDRVDGPVLIVLDFHALGLSRRYWILRLLFFEGVGYAWYVLDTGYT